MVRVLDGQPMLALPQVGVKNAGMMHHTCLEESAASIFRRSHLPPQPLPSARGSARQHKSTMSLLRQSVRYAYYLAAPYRDMASARSVVAQTNAAYPVVVSNLALFQSFLLPGFVALTGLGAYGYMQYTAPVEAPMGFVYEKEAVGEVPQLEEQFQPVVKRVFV
jgi:hypothetical protein